MASAFNIDGLASGLDTTEIIRKLMEAERQPLLRMRADKADINLRLPEIQGINSLLLSLKNFASDLKIKSTFQTRTGSSSDADIVKMGEVQSTAQTGSWTIDSVTRLATSTVALSNRRLGGGIDPTEKLADVSMQNAVTEGTFTINGVSFFVDPDADSLDDVIAQINGQSGVTGVQAAYDGTTDRFRLENVNAGNTATINLGATGDTSNFLTASGMLGTFQDTSSGKTVITMDSHLGAIDTTLTLENANFAEAVTSGSFKINGVTIDVNAEKDTLEKVIQRINDSAAGVTATYDRLTDKLKITRDDTGEPLIDFEEGTSNFLDAVNLYGFESSGSIAGGPPGNVALDSISTNVAFVSGNPARNRFRIITNLGTYTFTGVDQNIGIDGIVARINDPAAQAVTGVKASYDQQSGKFKLEEITPGTVTSLDANDINPARGNIMAVLGIKDPLGVDLNGVFTLESPDNIGTPLDSSRLMSRDNYGTTVTAGQLTVTLGGGAPQSIDYDPATQTTDDLIAAFDAIGISLSYDAAGDGFTLKPKTGVAESISIVETGGGNFLDVAGLTDLTNPQTAGKNAEYQLDGATYYSNSNTIENRIDGVSFTLKETTAEPITLTVASDSSTAQTNIRKFVEKFNEVLTKINELVTEEGGVLEDDTGLRDIQSALRRLVNGTVRGTGSVYTSLSSIGITSGKIGQAFSKDYIGLLEIDEETLQAALNDDPDGVADLFFFDPTGGANYSQGIGRLFETTLAPLTNPSGTLDQRIKLLGEESDDIDQRIADLESSLLVKEEGLRRQFTSLEVIMSQMQQQGQWLSAQLGSLSGFGG